MVAMLAKVALGIHLRGTVVVQLKGKKGENGSVSVDFLTGFTKKTKLFNTYSHLTPSTVQSTDSVVRLDGLPALAALARAVALCPVVQKLLG